MDDYQVPANQSVIVGKKLKEYFENLGYTQQFVADKLGVSQAAVSALLNGKPFGKKLAVKWGDTFGIKPNWLLTGEGDMLKKDNKVDDNIVSAPVENANDDSLIDYLKELVAEKDKKIEELNRYISKLEMLLDVNSVDYQNIKRAV